VVRTLGSNSKRCHDRVSPTNPILEQSFEFLQHRLGKGFFPYHALAHIPKTCFGATTAQAQGGSKVGGLGERSKSLDHVLSRRKERLSAAKRSLFMRKIRRRQPNVSRYKLYRPCKWWAAAQAEQDEDDEEIAIFAAGGSEKPEDLSTGDGR
jgi:hypothetical protein